MLGVLRGGPVRRGGLSLVEVLLACVLLVVLAVPLLDVLRGLRLGYAHSADRTTASFVAQAVLEEIRYRLYAFGRGKDGVEGFEDLFAGFSEEGARVASWRDSERSRYFASFENLRGTGLHGFTPEQHPEIYARLYDMTCTVTVHTPIPAREGGEPETGLAEIEVRVSLALRRGGLPAAVARPADHRHLPTAPRDDEHRRSRVGERRGRRGNGRRRGATATGAAPRPRGGRGER